MTANNDSSTTVAKSTKSTKATTAAKKGTAPKGRLASRMEEPPEPVGHGENAMYVGIDLGTSRTSISASNGQRHTVPSWVGYPRDPVAQRRLHREVLIGEDALNNRLALEMVKPLKKGIIDVEQPRCSKAVQELLKHVIELCEVPHGQQVYAVIGVPARASIENQKAILKSVDSLVTSAMVASEPFAVAFGLELLTEALVVDIGAGTIDLCRMHGTIPEETDQITLYNAGDAVDQTLEQEILKAYQGVQLTRNMARLFKEKHGFVSNPSEKCLVTLTEEGRPSQYDITDQLKKACNSIVPDVINAIHKLIGTFDPEFQATLRNNVILAGGGSRMNGLPLLVEKGLQKLGGGRVIAVDEPTYAGSSGALKMAMEMPAAFWKAFAA